MSETRLIPPEEIKLRTVWNVPSEDNDKAHGFGGQHVGTPRATRAEHEPTGTVVYIADGRSGYYQREVALDAFRLRG